MFPGFTRDRPMGSRKKPESAFKRLGFSESEDDSTSEHEPFDLEPTVPDYLKDDASATSAKKKLAGFKSLQTLFQGADGADDADEDEEQEEEEDGEDAQKEEEENGENHDDNLDFEFSRRSDMSVASPAPIVPQHSTSETSRLIEQFMQPVKSQKRVNKHAHKALTSSRSKPVQKGCREISPHQTLLSTAISSRVKSPANIMEISISSPSYDLPQRTKPLTSRSSQKRANPADTEEAERSTKISKAGHSQEIARRKTTLQITSHSSKSKVKKDKPKSQSAISTPVLFKSLAKKQIYQSGLTLKSEGAPSPASRPQSQSSISSFCIEIIPPSPLQPLTDNKSQESQNSSKPSEKPDTSGKPQKTEKSKKNRPSRKLQKVREKHPHDGLPYHGPTKDFKVLVSPRRLPQHNGSSEFFVVDDDERDIQAFQYPQSRGIDRKMAAIERAKWALAFPPPCVTGDEVT